MPLRPTTQEASLYAWLASVTDEHRMTQAKHMLTSGKCQLYAELTPTEVIGVGRSHHGSHVTYSSHLQSDGHFCCVDHHLELCPGLHGYPCTHLMVLLMGLAQTRRLSPDTIRTWVGLSIALPTRSRVRVNTTRLADTLIKFKGAQAGQVDWRPIETIPEDYYAL